MRAYRYRGTFPHWRRRLTCRCACLAGERDSPHVTSTRRSGTCPPHPPRQGSAQTASHCGVRGCGVADRWNLVADARSVVQRLEMGECRWVELPSRPGSSAHGRRSSEAPRETWGDDVRDAGALGEAGSIASDPRGSAFGTWWVWLTGPTPDQDCSTFNVRFVDGRVVQSKSDHT